MIFILCCACARGQSNLMNEVQNLTEIEIHGKFHLIKSGVESGHIKTLMRYEIYSVDSLDFKRLLFLTKNNQNFKEGRYYLNLELDSYCRNNNLEVLNLSNSMVSQNEYDRCYFIYLFSDYRTFAICKVNNS